MKTVFHATPSHIEEELVCNQSIKSREWVEQKTALSPFSNLFLGNFDLTLHWRENKQTDHLTIHIKRPFMNCIEYINCECHGQAGLACQISGN